MVRIKIDNRIRNVIEIANHTQHRALFVIIGEKSRDQAITLYHIMNKTQYKTRPSVLWCYKKELGFSTHRKKRLKEVQKLQKVGLGVDEDNPLDMFISSANVRWCYYHETHKILGQTFQMLVLQDFEAMQPNLLARTIETVEGGGLVVILLNTLNSLQQFCTMSMDVHARYRTESHQDVVSRFNERFILSLMDCANCCVIDDKLNVVPVKSQSSDVANAQSYPELNEINHELVQLIDSLENKEPLKSLVSLCKTVDQAKSVIKFTDALVKKTTQATVSLTAARGRGKSAALGISIASAIAHGYSNIHVTSPSPENLHTLFEFVIKGLEAINLINIEDFTVIRTPEHDNAVVKIHVYKDNNQVIQYIDPLEAAESRLAVQLSNLFVIDEAAAIPLPIVRTFLSAQLVFMASTINGYEGTGRSLSLKLLSQLRQAPDNKTSDSSINSRLLSELTLDEPIRYAVDDPVESWLNQLLCLDATISELPWTAGCPVPDQCQLFYINRDTLFSYHKASEEFLHHLMTLYVASHYKNTPNDLQMMSDAPAHHLFCLLPPGRKVDSLPEVLCFVQVCLEGMISKESILQSLNRGKRAASGDLIPWTIARQFNEENFASLSGARIVRIATNPNYQKMGYGTRALQLIYDYYSGAFSINLSEEINDDVMNGNSYVKKKKSKNKPRINSEEPMEVSQDISLQPRTSLPSLLMSLDERKAEELDYLGVSFGLTSDLLKFWKRNKYIPIYIRQTPSDITGEHSCIMLRKIIRHDSLNNGNGDDGAALDLIRKRKSEDWLKSFFQEFKSDFFELLVHQFKHFSPQLSLGILRSMNTRDALEEQAKLSRDELYKFFLTSRKLAILQMYSKTLAEYHQILPMLLKISKLYFLGWLPASVDLSAVQSTILLAIGVQGKSISQTAKELGLDSTQLLGLFGRALKKIETHLRSIEHEEFEKEVVRETVTKITPVFEPMKESLDEELGKAAKKFDEKLNLKSKLNIKKKVKKHGYDNVFKKKKKFKNSKN